jgi:hypothetical protein
VDLRRLVGAEFDALAFVLDCAARGRVDVDGKGLTLLTAPMAGFYDVPKGAPNPGRTQLRIAYVEPPERMALVPELLATLLERYLREEAPSGGATKARAARPPAAAPRTRARSGGERGAAPAPRKRAASAHPRRAK